MAHLRFLVRIALAAVATITASALVVPTGRALAAGAAGTPLPPGWELCILAGVAAPATAANVADLDGWQAAEGGSTNNTAAYNPFNTRRTTDISGAPLPLTMSANGFPAYSDWLAGCAATVATLSQPNMWPITAALDAGTVSPVGAFLAVVDQSAWCAPSADGAPCYASAIGGATGVPSLVSRSEALQVYGSVRGDLHAYQAAVTTVATDQQLLTARSEELGSATTSLATDRVTSARVEHQLRSFAVDEYVTSHLFEGSAFLGGADAGQSENSAAAQQYTSAAAGALVARDQAATEAVNAAVSRHDAAVAALQKTTGALASDQNLEERALVRLAADLATLQTAGACTTVSVLVGATSSPSSAATSGASTSITSKTSPTTTTTGAAPPTSTTTTSTAPTSTTTTTSTTTPTSSTTTTTTATQSRPQANPNGAPLATSTTTLPVHQKAAAPDPTTSTTTSTSSASGDGSKTNAVANPVGIASLQTCVASLAPNPQG